MPAVPLRAGEEASPRAKANLIRGVLCGTLDLNLLTSDEFKTIADLCVHCHACRLECPAGVDIPRLMRESKGAYVAANGLPLADWAMTRLDLLGAIGGLIAPAANWAMGNRQMRWLLEKTLGISQGRKLPRVASRSFLRRAARRRLTRPSRRSGQKVLYFVDVYANYFDPQLAEALVAVLEHNGIAVYVHPEQKQAGMPSIACGALEHARQLAEHNVALLAESVRQGYHVVATEPAAALCLVHEYPQLLDDDDARLVAANSTEACTYLWNMHTRGQLQLDFRPLGVALGYHLPCHLRALEVGSPGEQLLGLIPGLRLRRVEAGCSGMAGTFGLLHKNYRNSLRAGWKLISRLRDPRPASRHDRVQHVQDADGAGRRQTDHPPHQAAGPGLRPDAGNRPAARLARRGVDRNMSDPWFHAGTEVRLRRLRRLLHRGAGLRVGQQGRDRSAGRGDAYRRRGVRTPLRPQGGDSQEPDRMVQRRLHFLSRREPHLPGVRRSAPPVPHVALLAVESRLAGGVGRHGRALSGLQPRPGGAVGPHLGASQRDEV